MNTTDELFLQALDAALCGGQVRWEQSIAEEDWRTLIEMARIHHVLPMVFGAVYACPAIGNASAQLMKACKRDAMQQVMIQAAKTADALKLLTHEKHIPYEDYVRGVRANPIAVKVKLADIAHNSDQTRLSGCAMAEETKAYFRSKYAKAKAILLEE